MAIANIASSSASAIYQTNQAVSGASSQERPETGRSAGWAVDDTVEISSVGRLSAKVLSEQFSDDLKPGVFQASSAAFQSELGNRFRAANIDTTYPIELTTDSAGHVRVANDHPDKDKIEALFEQDAGLSNEFRRLSATASLKQAIEAHLEFIKAYEKNPDAAIAQFAELFSDSGPKRDVTFHFAQNEWGHA